MSLGKISLGNENSYIDLSVSEGEIIPYPNSNGGSIIYKLLAPMTFSDVTLTVTSELNDANTKSRVLVEGDTLSTVGTTSSSEQSTERFCISAGSNFDCEGNLIGTPDIKEFSPEEEDVPDQ
jgi:hypothetical protein